MAVYNQLFEEMDNMLPTAKKQMTLAQFLREVKGLNKQWILSSLFSGNIRTRSGVHPEPTCPITVLCREKTGISLDNSQYHGAAQELGLNPRLARSIVYAADNEAMGKRERRIRQALLKATGLVKPKKK